jgi:ubiquitin carboxyl-terminal hydrolase 5/13
MSDAPFEFDQETVNLSHSGSITPSANEKIMPEEQTQSTSASGPQVDAGAVDQLMSMGFSQPRATRALLANANAVEPAMEWLFGHMDDASLDDPIVEQTSAAASVVDSGVQEALISSLVDMGFSQDKAAYALSQTDNNPERALDFLFSHPDLVVPVAGSSASTAKMDAALGSKTQTVYNLHGLVSHKGTSVHCGHYVSYKRHPELGWVLMNDEKVVKSDLNSEGAQQAYVCIFARRD